jgi:flavodoxin I
MARIGIFYGSTTGNTERVAELIEAALEGADVTVADIADVTAAELEGYDVLILGTSTWGAGDLQDDWLGSLHALAAADLVGKKVALFGLGDQEGYPDTFLDALGELYERVKARGAEVVGAWPNVGYEFSESKAASNGKFVGLALDEDNQSGLTEQRVGDWVELLKVEIGV